MMKVHFQSEDIDHENNRDNKSNSRHYGFESKTLLDAFGDLLVERSQHFTTAPPPLNRDIWKRKPPDFTPRVYDPKPPKRNSREAIQPWKYFSASDQRMLERKAAASDGEECCLPQIFRDTATGDANDANKCDEFVTRFKTIGQFDAKVLFVRHGMRRRSAYRMPKPHDFRGLPPIESLGLPEFSTQYERDPYNLKFNKENPKNVLGWSLPQPTSSFDPGSSVSPLTPQPKWDRNLILPKTQWPNKYAAYTRHRRWDRSAQSAKMERIEQQLTEQWRREEGFRRQSSNSLHATNTRPHEP